MNNKSNQKRKENKNGSNYQNKKRNNNRKGGNKRSEKMEDINKKKMDMSVNPHILTDGSHDNDGDWYDNVPGLLLDYANLPFSRPLGIGFDPMARVDLTNAPRKMAQPVLRCFPGIIRYDLAPTPGVSLDHTSPINIASQQLYTEMRSVNSGAKNYDKTDVMLILMAMSSVYALYAECARAYKCFGDYEAMNRYLPETMLNALGFSADLQEQMSDFRGAMDLFAAKIASVNIPDKFDYIRRQRWLYETVYTDAPAVKSQAYVFVPRYYYVFTEGTDSTPSYLHCVERSALFGDANVSTVKQIQKAIDTLMKPILGSEDFSLINGDIRKTWGDSEMVKVRLLDQIETLEFAYSEEVLHEIMNAQMLSVQTSSLDITQDLSSLSAGPQLHFSPTFTSSDYFNTDLCGYRKALINFIDVEPTPKNIAVATRFQPTIDANDTDSRITSCGSEIVTAITSYTHTIDTKTGALKGVTVEMTRQDHILPIGNISTATEVSPSVMGELQNDMLNIIKFSAFDYLPTQYIWIQSIGSDDLSLMGPIQDVQNYKWCTHEELINLNDCVMMSLWTPQGATKPQM